MQLVASFEDCHTTRSYWAESLTRQVKKKSSQNFNYRFPDDVSGKWQWLCSRGQFSPLKSWQEDDTMHYWPTYRSLDKSFYLSESQLY